MFLFTTNSVIFLVVAIGSGLASGFYLLASLAPMLDKDCPYRTPLTYFFLIFLSTFGALILSIIIYIAIVISSIGNWIHDRKIVLRDITLRHLWHVMKRNTALMPLLSHLFKSWFKGESAAERHDIVHRNYHPSRGRTTLSVKELLYVTTYTDLLQNPRTAQYMARRLFDMEREGIAEYIAQLREHRSMVARLVSAFNRVDSPQDAIGSVRLLQMLLLADDPARVTSSHDEVAKREDARWKQLRARLNAACSFARLNARRPFERGLPV
ncbi:unnamed protein product [Peniophora sp. CBMAI 1063]|nr:unnamed protein product [Peniophora sp. CBMAI 1063]